MSNTFDQAEMVILITQLMHDPFHKGKGIGRAIEQYEQFTQQHGTAETRSQLWEIAGRLNTRMQDIIEAGVTDDWYEELGGCWDFDFMPAVLMELPEHSTCWLEASDLEIEIAMQQAIYDGEE